MMRLPTSSTKPGHFPRSLAFNQDSTCAIVGTGYGVRVYHLDPFSLAFSTNSVGPTACAEMLFRTSLVAVVGTGDVQSRPPRRVSVIATKQDECSPVCDISVKSTVLAVRMNMRHLFVVMEQAVLVYALDSMELLHTVKTAPNKGCVFAANSDTSVRSRFAVPVSPLVGEAVVYDATSGISPAAFKVHHAPIKAIALSTCGDLLATASDKGTVIRVFRVSTHEKMYTLRRGMQSATIYGLRFGLADTALCASSSSGTVHIWALSSLDSAAGSSASAPSASASSSHSNYSNYTAGSSASLNHQQGSLFPAGSDSCYADEPIHSASSSNASLLDAAQPSTIGAMLSMLPGGLNDMVDSVRSFATARLDTPGVFNVASLVPNGPRGPRVQVITENGDLILFDLDTKRGGECKRVGEHSFLDGPDERM